MPAVHMTADELLTKVFPDTDIKKQRYGIPVDRYIYNSNNNIMLQSELLSPVSSYLYNLNQSMFMIFFIVNLPGVYFYQYMYICSS